MTTNTEGLKPCPHCGNTDLKIGNSPGGFRWVYCLPCHVVKHCGDEVEAIAVWNRRPTAQASEAIRQAVPTAEEFTQASDLTVSDDWMLGWNDCRALSTMPVEPVTTKPLQVGMEDIAKFAGLVLKAHRNDGEPGDVDGASLQDFALECGLIEEIEVNEPCSSRCTCLEYGGIYGFPQNCLFTTVVGKSVIAAADPTQAMKDE